MVSKFVQDAQAETLGRWLRLVNYDSAQTLGVEREVYEALARAERRKKWSPIPISPLAEPTNLQELVGDHFNGAQEELANQARRVDNLYTWLNTTNNVYKAELESVEKNVQVATDALQDILVVKSVNTEQSLWVSDTYNTTAHIDRERTTAQVDTDHGMVTLSARSLQVVDNIQPFINDKETIGTPGCTLLILDRGNQGGPEREPQPLFESQQNTDFANVFDSDSQSWFELERNFIKPKQKCSLFGRAYVKNSAGSEVDVLQVTSNLDWRAYVQWFNRALPDAGDDGKGKLLAEFRDLDLVNSTTPGVQTPQSAAQDTAVRLSFDIVLLGKQPLTYVNLIPFTRGTTPVRLDLLKVFSDDFELVIAKDVELNPTSNSTTSLTREVLRTTGTQTVGGLYTIPTDRPITRVQVKLSSLPEKASNGLGHPFAEKYEVTRKEQRLVFFSRVDRDYVWTRIPINEQPPTVFGQYTRNKILGSVPSTLSSLLQYARDVDNKSQGLLNTAERGASQINNILSSFGVKNQSASIASNLGQIQAGLSAVGLGSVLGKAVPVVGGIIAAVDLAQQLFGFSKSTELLEVRRGYDVFDGWRAAIGLRDIKLTQVEFNPTSTLISLPRYFSEPVKKLGLFVEEEIPESWGQGEWITYYLSVDGTTWMPVNKMQSSTIDASLTLETPTNVVWMRADLVGLPQDTTTGPRIKHSAIQGIPA